MFRTLDEMIAFRERITDALSELKSPLRFKPGGLLESSVRQRVPGAASGVGSAERFQHSGTRIGALLAHSGNGNYTPTPARGPPA